MPCFRGAPAASAAFALLFLLPGYNSSAAEPTKTKIKVTDSRLTPARGAKVLIYSTRDEPLNDPICEGNTDDAGIFVCPEIDVDHKSLLVVAVHGALYANKEMTLTGKRDWPSTFDVKLRDPKLQPTPDSTVRAAPAAQIVPGDAVRFVVRSYYAERLQLHRDAYGRYFYLRVLVPIEAAQPIYFSRSPIVYPDACSCLP